MSRVQYSNAGWGGGGTRYLGSLGMRTTDNLNVVTRFDKRSGAARSNRSWEWRNFYSGSGGFEPRAGEGGEHWGGKGGMDKGGKDGKGKRGSEPRR